MFKDILITIAVISLAIAGVGYLGALYKQPVNTLYEAQVQQYEPWTAKAKAEVQKSHQKAFIHFTGEGCLDCHAQWVLVNKAKLQAAADKANVKIYEANLIPGSDNTFILKELQDYKRGGVPAYIFINSKGEVSVLEPPSVFDMALGWNENNLIDPINKLS